MEQDYGSMAEQVRKTLELSEENNKMLKAMRRDRWIGLVVNLVFWAAVLFVSYYLTMQILGPMLAQLQGSEGQSADLMQLLEQYRTLLQQ